jgi:hypothetical protein
MLSQADNELICRVGPGTPMGELMRRHRISAPASRDLKADGEPVRVMLLGEKLIAWRDSLGRVGLMDHECPHRCASLFDAERAGRPALRLSRLEVRRERKVPRHAERASRNTEVLSSNLAGSANFDKNVYECIFISII